MKAEHLVPFIVLFFALPVIAAIFGAIIALTRREDSPQHHEACEALLSQGELAFYRVLKQAVNPAFTLMLKVRMADIVQPKKQLSRGTKRTALNKIIQKHADFVLCDASTLQIRVVIELDDKSHFKQDSKKRDQTKDAALKSAGIPILRIRASNTYSAYNIWQQLSALVPAGPPPLNRDI